MSLFLRISKPNEPWLAWVFAALASMHAMLLERFRERIEVLPSGCWRWTGVVAGFGYGRYEVRCFDGQRRSMAAHRFMYIQAKGPIAAGLVTDHLCRNPWCVNPAHLEAVTPHENTRRCWHANALAHNAGTCTRGHPLTPENTWRRNTAVGEQRGMCKICAHERLAGTPGYRSGAPKPLKTQCKNGHEFTPQNTRWSVEHGYLHRVCRACKRDAWHARGAARYKERKAGL